MAAMVDATARSLVRNCLDDFLADRITYSELCDRLLPVRTQDATVGMVVERVLDDLNDLDELFDCRVPFTRDAWKLIQRLLLVLDSSAEVRTHRLFGWHDSQWIAVASMVGLGMLFWNYPQYWWLPFVAGSAIVMPLARWREHGVQSRFPAEPADPWHAWPFPSLEAIRRAKLRAPQFVKRRYPRELATRDARHWIQRLGDVTVLFPTFLMRPLRWLGYCLGGWLLLPLLALPLFATRYEYVEPESPIVMAG